MGSPPLHARLGARSVLSVYDQVRSRVPFTVCNLAKESARPERGSTAALEPRISGRSVVHAAEFSAGPNAVCLTQIIQSGRVFTAFDGVDHLIELGP